MRSPWQPGVEQELLRGLFLAPNSIYFPELFTGVGNVLGVDRCGLENARWKMDSSVFFRGKQHSLSVPDRDFLPVL